MGMYPREYPIAAADGGIDIWSTDDATPNANFNFERHIPPATRQTPGGTVQPPITPTPMPGSSGWPVVGGNVSEAMQQAQLAWKKALDMMGLTGLIPGDLQQSDASMNAILDYVISTKPELVQSLANNGWDVSTPEAKRAAITKWWAELAPENTNKTKPIGQYAKDLGYTGDITGPTGEAGWTIPKQQWEWQRGVQFPWQQQQYAIGTLAGLSGPKDWIKHAIAQAQFQGAGVDMNAPLASMFNRPSAFGPTAPSASWEQTAQDYAMSLQNQRAGTPGATTSAASPFLQAQTAQASAPPGAGATGQVGGAVGIGAEPGGPPTTPAATPAGTTPTDLWSWLRNQPLIYGHKISAKDYNLMPEWKRQMQSGLWSYQGLDPAQEWENARRSWLTSSQGAPAGTRYRGAW